jgi:hypothetical protein
MADIYGAPQTLTGAETVNIIQIQNGQPVLCSITLNQIIGLIAPAPTLNALLVGLPTAEPTIAGEAWNNGGVLSISG